MLSDREIKDRVLDGSLVFYPLPPDSAFQPASVDLELEDIAVSLAPGEFRLVKTRQRVELPVDLAGVLFGKSSVGRKGLMIHTAGFVDPGFRGVLVLELANVGLSTVVLTPYMPICQIVFHQLGTPADSPYAGQFQDQE